MQHMQEAYELLVIELKEEIKRYKGYLEDRMGDQRVISEILFKKIISLSSRDEALAVAEKVDEAIDNLGWFVEMIEDSDWGLDK